MTKTRKESARLPIWRRLLTGLGLLILLLILVTAVADLLDLRVRKTTTQTSSYVFTGRSIALNGINNGSVTIVAGSSGTITVKHTVTEGIKKLHTTIAAHGGAFSISEDNCGGIALGLYGNCVSRYTLTIPANVSVTATGENTDYRLSGVNGNVSLKTDNGDVAVHDVTTGSLVLHSSNGDVTATDTHARTITATTDNGDITLQLSGVPTGISAHSDNGDVTIQLMRSDTAYKTHVASNTASATANIKTDPASSHTLSATSDNGTVRVSY